MDYVILHSSEFSKQEKDSLESLYKNFKFKQINLNNYERLIDPNKHQHGAWAYYKLDAFMLEGYDKVNVFDIDMLVNKPLDSFFNMKNDDSILGCKDEIGCEVNSKDFANDHMYINTGVLSIGKSLLSKDVYSLIVSNLSKELKHADQTLIIKCFKENIKRIDTTYNTGYKLIMRGIKNLKNISIIHFPGSGKPWKHINNYSDNSIDINKISADSNPYFLWVKNYTEMLNNERTNKVVL
jgi:lipopolysaccharide biosynthesis glycosyltransferase